MKNTCNVECHLTVLWRSNVLTNVNNLFFIFLWQNFKKIYVCIYIWSRWEIKFTVKRSKSVYQIFTTIRFRKYWKTVHRNNLILPFYCTIRHLNFGRNLALRLILTQMMNDKSIYICTIKVWFYSIEGIDVYIWAIKTYQSS